MSLKHINDILLLGNPQLYQPSTPITYSQLQSVNKWVLDLHNVMNQVRQKYNFGRGIAAPQLGYKKRLVYINIDKPIVIINPQYTYQSQQKFEVWDDCMCLPNLFVKVLRHKTIKIKYLDQNWNQQTWEAHDDIAQLLQHQIDHLDGILCTMRAIDEKSFKYRV